MKNKQVRHNYKLTEEQKKEIVVSHFLNRTNENTEFLCSKYGITRQTIYNLSRTKEGKELIEQTITASKKNFTKKIDLLIDKTLDKLIEKIENDDMTKTSYKDIAVMIGTLYDKARLEQNLSTSNNAININIKVEK